MPKIPLALAVAAALCAGPAAAAAPAAKDAPRLADLAWLAGEWRGEGIAGAPATEAYSTGPNGGLVGHFQQLKPDGSVMFYELITIGEVDGVITYSLKHFNADLTGWEKADEVRRFPLRDAITTPTGAARWDFSGMVYERRSPTEMTVTVPTRAPDGTPQSLTFHFHRQSR